MSPSSSRRRQPQQQQNEDSEGLTSAKELLASRQRSSALPRIHRKVSTPRDVAAVADKFKVDQAAVRELQEGDNVTASTQQSAAQKYMTVVLGGEELQAEEDDARYDGGDGDEGRKPPEDVADRGTIEKDTMSSSDTPKASFLKEQDTDDGQKAPEQRARRSSDPHPSSPPLPASASKSPETSVRHMYDPSSSSAASQLSPRKIPSLQYPYRQICPPSFLSLPSPSKKSVATNQQTRGETVSNDDEGFHDYGKSETGSDDDDDDEEEPEPSLKYQRLKGSIPDILKKDTASALAVSDKFLVVGTHAGMVFILDHAGNLVKAFRLHSASVLDISIDSAAEFVAAAGMDGLLSISSLSSAEHYTFDFKRPMRTVSLEPGFGRKITRAFVCGGMAGALIHREKGWLGHKETVLHAAEGPIWAVRWCTNFIAWANDAGVRVYDTFLKTKITFISAPNGQDRVDLFRPHLFWQDDRTLIIAWADQIKIAKVRERRANTGTNRAMIAAAGLAQSATQTYVEVVQVFQLDCAISGVAPYKDQLLVLAYVTANTSSEGDTDEDVDEETSFVNSDSLKPRRSQSAPRLARAIGQRPELRIIDPESGEEKSSDVLSLVGFERLGCNDYHLIPAQATVQKPSSATTQHKRHGETRDIFNDLFYVVSPHDVVIARPRDAKDHVNWLLEHKKYEAALNAVSEMGSEAALAAGFDSKQIGKKYLTHLVDEVQDFDLAAQVGTDVLAGDASGWEEWIFLFLNRGQIDRLVAWIPTENPVLPNLTYDIVLLELFKTDRVRLKEVTNVWPPAVFSSQAVALAIEDRLRQEQHEHSLATPASPTALTSETTLLMEILADLYVRSGQPGKGLEYYLRLKRPGVFDLIRDNNLILHIRDQARQLIEFETEVDEGSRIDGGANLPKSEQFSRAIQLLLDNVHSIPPERVVPQLESLPVYLHRYLSALFDIDLSLVIPYTDLQISLYARFSSPKLMNYLRSMSSYYSFENAFSVCERYDLVSEMVFLLGRVGDNKRALNLIIERLGDVERAIDFAKEQNDDDLWQDVLRYSETRPPFIRGLLENVGGVEKIDPVQLIQRIRDGLEVPGLRDALRKILSDYNLQVSLLEGCLDVMEAEGRALMHQRSQAQNQGIALVTAGATDAASAESSEKVGESGTTGSVLTTITRCQKCGLKAASKSDSAMRFDRRESNGTTSIVPVQTAGRDTSRTTDTGTIVVFLCRHVYHLSCLLPVHSIPQRRCRRLASGEVDESDDVDTVESGGSLTLGRIDAMVTQRNQWRRWGQKGAPVTSVDDVFGSADVPKSDRGEELWGPAMRAASQRRRWQQAQSYTLRLKVPLKAHGNCPACSARATAAAKATIEDGVQAAQQARCGCTHPQ